MSHHDQNPIASRTDAISDDAKVENRDLVRRTLDEAVADVTRDGIERRKLWNDVTNLVLEQAITDSTLRDRITTSANKARLGTAVERPKVDILMSGGANAWTVPVSPGLHVLALPYDDGHAVAGLAGDQAQNFFDTANGRAQAFTSSGEDGDEGFRNSGAGLSVWVLIGQTGTLEVRPYMKYDYRASVSAFGLSGWTRGQVDAAATINGGVVASRTKLLFDHMSQSDFEQEIADTMYVPDIQLRFPVVAGQLYVVTFSVQAMRDMSGFPFPGHSYASSRVHINVPFIVAELF